MPYPEFIYFEGRHVNNLGPNTPEDEFYGIYDAILSHWFTSSCGYLLDPQSWRGGAIYIVRRGGEAQSPLLVVEMNRPSKWMAVANAQDEVDCLQSYMREKIKSTKYKTIYGIRCIGVHWIVYKLEKLGDTEPALVTVLDWQDDITSDSSYTHFQALVDLVHSIT